VRYPIGRRHAVTFRSNGKAPTTVDRIINASFRQFNLLASNVGVDNKVIENNDRWSRSMTDR
jgi:hypothetical protein